MKPNIEWLTLILITITIILLFILISQNDINNNKTKCECYSDPNLIPNEIPEQINIVQESSQSVILDSVSNIVNQINPFDSKPTLVLYYTTWCGYSQQFMPVWNELKESKLSELVSFEQLDCDKSDNLCRQDNIFGYPSLTLKKSDGTVIKFSDNEPRTKDKIIEFVKDNI